MHLLAIVSKYVHDKTKSTIRLRQDFQSLVPVYCTLFRGLEPVELLIEDAIIMSFTCDISWNR